MARVASVFGLQTLGFLLLCCTCFWPWVAPLLRLSRLGLVRAPVRVVVRMFRHWLCLSPAFRGWGLWLVLLGKGFGLDPGNFGWHPRRVCLDMLSPSVLGWSLAGRVVPRPSQQIALWVQFPAIPGRGLLLGLAG